MKKERERSPLSQEDETQTSSPGGWHSKLSALNFLHLQVHRRNTATSSRASSRKSSRASDASDLSELAGPWLNLPLMLVGGAGDMLKEMKPPEDDKKYAIKSHFLLLFVLLHFQAHNQIMVKNVFLVSFYSLYFNAVLIQEVGHHDARVSIISFCDTRMLWMIR